MVGVEGADVEAGTGHLPGVEGGDVGEIAGEVAGGIEAASVSHAVLDQREVASGVDIERWDRPVGDGMLGFLLHLKHFHFLVYPDDAGALQFPEFRFVMAHDDGGAFLLEVVYEALEGEVEDVVGCKHHYVVVDRFLIYGKEEIADRAKACLVGLGAVVNDGDGLAVVGLTDPFPENVGESVVSDYDVPVYVGYCVKIGKHTVEDSAIPNLEERFGEVFGERI